MDLQKLQVYIIKSVTKAVFSSSACPLVVLMEHEMYCGESRRGEKDHTELSTG